MRLGLCDDDIEKIVTLHPRDFTPRELAALQYARAWAVNRGRDPGGEASAAFRSHFSSEEQAFILKVLRMMKLANYTSNTLFGIPWREALNETPLPENRGWGVFRLASGRVEGVLSRVVVFARRQAGCGLSRGVAVCQGALGLSGCGA